MSNPNQRVLRTSEILLRHSNDIADRRKTVLSMFVECADFVNNKERGPRPGASLFPQTIDPPSIIGIFGEIRTNNRRLLNELLSDPSFFLKSFKFLFFACISAAFEKYPGVCFKSLNALISVLENDQLEKLQNDCVAMISDIATAIGQTADPHSKTTFQCFCSFVASFSRGNETFIETTIGSAGHTEVSCLFKTVSKILRKSLEFPIVRKNHLFWNLKTIKMLSDVSRSIFDGESFEALINLIDRMLKETTFEKTARADWVFLFSNVNWNALKKTQSLKTFKTMRVWIIKSNIEPAIKGLAKEKITAILISRLKNSRGHLSFNRNIELISDNVELFDGIQIKSVLSALSSAEIQKLVHYSRSAGDHVANIIEAWINRKRTLRKTDRNKSEESDQKLISAFIKYNAFCVDGLTKMDYLLINSNKIAPDKFALAKTYEKTKVEIKTFLANPDLGKKCELILSILTKVSENIIANGQKIFSAFAKALVSALGSGKCNKQTKKSIVADLINFVGKAPKIFEAPTLLSVIEIAIESGDDILNNPFFGRIVHFSAMGMDRHGVSEFFGTFAKIFLSKSLKSCENAEKTSSKRLLQNLSSLLILLCKLKCQKNCEFCFLKFDHLNVGGIRLSSVNVKAEPGADNRLIRIEETEFFESICRLYAALPVSYDNQYGLAFPFLAISHSGNYFENYEESVFRLILVLRGELPVKIVGENCKFFVQNVREFCQKFEKWFLGGSTQTSFSIDSKKETLPDLGSYKKLIVFCFELMAGNHEHLKALVQIVLRALIYAEMRDFCFSQLLHLSEMSGYNDNDYLIGKMSHIPYFIFQNLGGLSLEELKHISESVLDKDEKFLFSLAAPRVIKNVFIDRNAAHLNKLSLLTRESPKTLISKHAGQVVRALLKTGDFESSQKFAADIFEENEGAKFSEFLRGKFDEFAFDIVVALYNDSERTNWLKLMGVFKISLFGLRETGNFVFLRNADLTHVSGFENSPCFIDLLNDCMPKVIAKTKKLSSEFPKQPQLNPNLAKKENKTIAKTLSAISVCARALKEILGPAKAKRFLRQSVDLLISTVKTGALSRSEPMKALFLNVLAIMEKQDFFDPLIVDAAAFLIAQEGKGPGSEKTNEFFSKSWRIISDVKNKNPVGNKNRLVFHPDSTPISATLAALASSIRHPTPAVKTIYLRKLHQTLKADWASIAEILKNSDRADPLQSEATFQLKKAVGSLIGGLLEISGHKTDTDSSIVLLKAKCLGELGAISPTLLDFNEANAAKSRETGSSLCLPDSTDRDLLPCAAEVFARELLANVLFPLMQKSSDEKLVFAAKRVLAAAGVDLETVRRHKRGKKRMRLANGKGVLEALKKGGFWVWSELPKEVRKVFLPLFEEGGAGESSELCRFGGGGVEGYYETAEKADFIKKDGSEKETTIYSKTESFLEWIGCVCHDLIKFSAGSPREKIFEAVKPVLKLYESVGEFLLPFLVFEISMAEDGFALNKIEQEFLEILSTPYISRQTDLKEQKNFLSVKTIFALLQNLQNWAETDRKGADPNQKRAPGRPQHAAAKTRIAALIRKIPVLLIAKSAFRCGAYSTAIRSAELYRRSAGHCFPSGPADRSLVEVIRKSFGETGNLDAMLAVSQLKAAEASPESSSEKKPESSSEKKPESSSDEAVENAIRMAYSFELQNQNQEAAECYEQLLQDAPANVGALKGHLRCLLRLGQYRAVQSHVRSAAAEARGVFDAVAEYGAQAAWRLQKWDVLEALDRGQSKCAVAVKCDTARILLAMRNKEWGKFERLVKLKRVSAMNSASLKFAESYDKAYRHLLELDQVRELEHAAKEIRTAHALGGGDERRWKNRFAVVSKNYEHVEPVLSQRRVVLRLKGLAKEEKNVWGKLVKAARKSGLLSVSKSLAISAKIAGVDQKRLLFEEAKILYIEKRVFDALKLLESNFDKHEKRGKLHYLFCKWVMESQAKNASEILSLLKTAQAETQNSKYGEKTLYLLGKYYDFLLTTTLETAKQPTLALKQIFYFSLRHYGSALKMGNRYLFSALPRVAFLFFRHCKAGPLNLEKDEAASELMKSLVQELSSSQWYSVATQIISNIDTETPTIQNVIKAIITKLFGSYPHQMCWQFLAATESSSFNIRHNSKRVLAEIKDAFRDKSAASHRLVEQAERLFECLRKIARKKLPNSKKPVWSFKETFPFLATEALTEVPFIVPNSFNMSAMNIAVEKSSAAYISSLDDSFAVFYSKETPLRIGFTGTDGRKHLFLLKVEKRGDLRKDAKMTLLFCVVNRLFEQSPAARARRLRVRSFFVALLSENCGLIEWVPNTCTFKAACHEVAPEYTLKACAQICGGRENLEKTDRKRMAHNLRLLLARQRPAFGRWLLRAFGEAPGAWLAAQTSFTRSSAAMAMLGAVVGLGDRHGENILVDRATGEAVHVDFDCIFDKGRRLAMPEVVPFRLTQNVVDGFGVAGVGHFRIVCEIVLRIFRDEKDTLLSVLHSFVSEPLLEHTKGNEQFRGETAAKAIDAVRARLNGASELKGVAMSVEGQVDHFIQCAASFENLAAMFFGWMPSL